MKSWLIVTISIVFGFIGIERARACSCSTDEPPIENIYAESGDGLFQGSGAVFLGSVTQIETIELGVLKISFEVEEWFKRSLRASNPFVAFTQSDLRWLRNLPACGHNNEPLCRTDG